MHIDILILISRTYLSKSIKKLKLQKSKKKKNYFNLNVRFKRLFHIFF